MNENSLQDLLIDTVESIFSMKNMSVLIMKINWTVCDKSQRSETKKAEAIRRRVIVACIKSPAKSRLAGFINYIYIKNKWMNG